jgi:hypothetical protein
MAPRKYSEAYDRFAGRTVQIKKNPVEGIVTVAN